MGLSTKQGSASIASLPNKHDYVINNVTTDSPEQRLIDQDYVKDIGINKTAINVDREKGMLTAINKFIGGSEIEVSYFHHQHSRVLDQSTDSDLSNIKNAAHADLLLINKFRFKLSDPLNYSFENGSVVSEVLGTGITYAGFNPVISDFFLYELEPGLLGQFKIIATPTRMSIKSGTCHEIQFRLEKIVSNEDIIVIKKYVVDERWFDTQNKMNETISLLVGSEIALIDTCNNEISRLLKQYKRDFYDKDMEAYMSPESVYDPYLVNFIYQVFPIYKLGSYGKKLLVEPEHMDNSIWVKILNTTDINHNEIKNRYTVETNYISVYTTYINSLANREYTLLSPSIDEPISTTVKVYPPFGDISGSDISTSFQKLLSVYVNNQIISPSELLLQIKNLNRQDKLIQFYQIPVYIYLLSEVISNVRYKPNRNKENIDNYLSNSSLLEPYNLSINNIIKLTGTSTFEVIAVKDELDNIYNLHAEDIEYFNDHTTVDLSRIFNIRGISSLIGKWYIITSKPNITIS